MTWKKVKLGEIITHRKGFITISDNEDYKLCRVQLHRKGVVLRQVVSGSTIRTKKQQLCKANDFIVAEMDAKVGGYGFIPENLGGAIVSSHYYLFEINEKLLKTRFLDVLIKTDILQNQIKATGSTNYASVRPADVLNWIIPLPSISEQEEIVEKYFAVEKYSNQIITELSHQLDIVKKLRQQILQDAVQGKLVNQNSDDEPASILLEKIKAEKEQLIKEKKVKKDKPLSPIKAEEIPFEIPENWVWCRLWEICENRLGKMLDAIKNKGEYLPYLRNLNVQWYRFELEDIQKMRFEKHELEEYSVKKGDLLVFLKVNTSAFRRIDLSSDLC